MFLKRIIDRNDNAEIVCLTRKRYKGDICSYRVSKKYREIHYNIG